MTLNRIRILILALAFCFAFSNFASSVRDSRTSINTFGRIKFRGYVVSNYNSTHYYAQNGDTGEYDWISSDAAITINYALNSLSTGRTWKEKVILNGNFTLNTYISVPSYTILKIQGRMSTSSVSTSLIRVYGSAGSHAQHVEIRGGSVILPSGTGWPAISLYYADDVLIEDVEAEGAGAVKLVRCNRIKIMRSRLIGIESSAILLMDTSNDVDVLYNFIAGTLGKRFQGILTQGATGCTRILIQENEITSFGGDIGAHGIYVGISDTHDIRIIGNDFHDALPNSGNAIRFDGTRGLISLNTFHDLTNAYSVALIGTCLSYSVVNNVTVINNSVSDVIRGFFIYANRNNVTEISIIANTISNASDFGILLLGEMGYYVHGVTVADNVISNCTNYGINLGTGTTNNTITNNSVTNSGISIIDYGVGNHVYNNTTT